MGQHPAVHADHHRQEDVAVFGNLESGNMGVVSLLAGFNIELDHTGIPETHGVALVYLNADGGRDGAVHPGDDKGQSLPDRGIEHLGHEQ